MAWQRRKRGPAKPKDTLGRLMVEGRTRSKIWVPCLPEDEANLREMIALAIASGAPTVDLYPWSRATIRVASIEWVQYFPSKVVAAEVVPDVVP